MRNIIYIGLLLTSANFIQGVVAVGDTLDSTTTFQFSIGSAIYNSQAKRLWTLSGQDTSGLGADIQKYGISYTDYLPTISSSSDSVVTLTSYPYLTDKALVVTTNEQGSLVVPTDLVDNPLLGKDLNLVTFLGSNLVVADRLAPRFMYYIQSVFFEDGISAGTTTSQGKSTLSLLDLGAGNEARLIAGSGLGVLFVAQSQGTFGGAGSSISCATTSVKSLTQEKNAPQYTTLIQQAQEPVTVSTSVLTANGPDVDAIGSLVSMYPSPTLLQMYVGVDVFADTVANSCAVGLFCAQYTTTTPDVIFSSVIPDTVAHQGFNTPITAPQNNRVAVANITTTTTSTGLSYIITSRYNNIGVQSVYAMPMVTKSVDNIDHGKVASFDSIAQTFKAVGTSYRSQGFDTVIDDAHEINIAGDDGVVARLTVGAGPVPLSAGNFIDQLFAQGDAVYISIYKSFGSGSTPGIFKSQALFDEQGRIISWSPWQRVAGTDDQVLFTTKNYDTGQMMYVSGQESNTIQQTTWNQTAQLESFIDAVHLNLSSGKGGVQGLMSVSNETTGIENFTLALATGYQTVVIGQTSSINSGNFTIDSPQEIVTINNSLGLDVGSVVTTTFADNGSGSNWFFMGGDDGLSVLSNDTTGITFTGSLTALDDLIDAGMSCKTVGSFKFVKKIAHDDSFLYVLTLDGVYRIALVANKFTLNNPADLNPVKVVAASYFGDFASCIDMIVDNGFMILGTTNGLYSIDLQGGLPATPQTISIPGGLPTVSRLQTISNSHLESGKGFYEHSNLYVLSIDYGTQESRLNRFAISNGQVEPIQDQLLQGQNGPLVIFDIMYNNLFIDGFFGFVTSYKMGEVLPRLTYVKAGLQGGKSSSQSLLPKQTNNFSAVTSERIGLFSPVASKNKDYFGFVGMVSDYGSGALIVAAEFGLFVQA